ncbi:hypothetical protein [Tychonema sp. LEGE 07203]|uniref:hypothetical protein n=1 Tax=Tychonema sp. LEGE 07203 TaxID=1828671 RepID=UPI0018823B72|nr:hypothetical protein [Tychonema sp. LEGE 07203]
MVIWELVMWNRRLIVINLYFLLSDLKVAVVEFKGVIVARSAWKLPDRQPAAAIPSLGRRQTDIN